MLLTADQATCGSAAPARIQSSSGDAVSSAALTKPNGLASSWKS